MTVSSPMSRRRLLRHAALAGLAFLLLPLSAPSSTSCRYYVYCPVFAAVHADLRRDTVMWQDEASGEQVSLAVCWKCRWRALVFLASFRLESLVELASYHIRREKAIRKTQVPDWTFFKVYQ